MALYRDEGVVLRVQKLGEADRIVTVLTRRNGRVRAVAKGVRRTRSKFGASVEPFSHVDLQLFSGQRARSGSGDSLDLVTQAESLTSYGERLVGDYGRYTAGTAVLETAERLTAEEREPALRLFLLVVGALRALTGGGPDSVPPRDPGLVLDAFLLRAMSVSGYAPALEECARCGAAGPHRAFSVPAGGLVCPGCRPAGAASPAPAALRLMVDLLTGDWDASEAAEAFTRREASGLVAAHLQWHLERGLRSLPLVER
ncbi:MAG: DNA repair protein RecO [Actinomycetota bacterium]|nr:DNA repair protein RecO [Actinomycetota bacterium]